MKYLFITVFFLFFLKSDISIFTLFAVKWQPSIILKNNFSKLKPGDILIKKKELKFLEWFGHCGIVTKEKKIAEIVSPVSVLRHADINVWALEGRSVIVLRLKNGVSSEFLDKISVTMNKSKGKKYGFVFKNSNSSFYCSQFIWYVFHNTINKYNLDFDDGPSVWPYDILFSDDVYIIDLDK